MRKQLTALYLLAATGLLLAVGGPKTFGQRHHYDDADLPEREETNQTYPLAPGARVDVSVIAGPVTIQTANVAEATVHIVRSAETRADLDSFTIAIDHSPDSLTVRFRDLAHVENLKCRQNVTLTVPRNINLRLNAIAGPVKVGEIDGSIHLTGISGRVDVEQAQGYSEISGISGVLTVNIRQLSERGIHISGISGRVELHLAEDLNANVSVSGIMGNIDIAGPNLSMTKLGSTTFSGRVGAGGAPISVSGISGHVAFRGGI